MKLEYNKTETVQEKDLTFIDKDGNAFTADAIRTDYVPTSFAGTPKNYVLRKGHENWDILQETFLRKIYNEWLEELGYDTSVYEVNFETKEIYKSFMFDSVSDQPPTASEEI
tara:strand:- start:1296 stop:1631 length:336 start_codon:yes stop_codon:yes gene_type:complete